MKIVLIWHKITKIGNIEKSARVGARQKRESTEN